MTDFEIDTNWVRSQYADRDLGYPNPDDEADFDTWLAEVIRVAREVGWDVGHNAHPHFGVNPYRKEQ